ncbi:hypothetical protein ACFQX6_12290 [Streptosporangium lutulentum]
MGQRLPRGLGGRTGGGQLDGVGLAELCQLDVHGVGLLPEGGEFGADLLVRSCSAARWSAASSRTWVSSARWVFSNSWLLLARASARSNSLTQRFSGEQHVVRGSCAPKKCS